MGLALEGWTLRGAAHVVAVSDDYPAMLRRRYPDASEEEITRRLTAWLQHRPGAERGDVSGPVRVRQIPE